MNDNNFALVIDDSVSMRQTVMSILRQNSDVGEIVEAGNPDDALRLLLQHDGKLQFIVSDWNMPGMPLAELVIGQIVAKNIVGFLDNPWFVWYKSMVGKKS